MSFYSSSNDFTTTNGVPWYYNAPWTNPLYSTNSNSDFSTPGKPNLYFPERYINMISDMPNPSMPPYPGYYNLPISANFQDPGNNVSQINAIYDRYYGTPQYTSNIQTNFNAVPLPNIPQNFLPVVQNFEVPKKGVQEINDIYQKYFGRPIPYQDLLINPSVAFLPPNYPQTLPSYDSFKRQGLFETVQRYSSQPQMLNSFYSTLEQSDLYWKNRFQSTIPNFSNSLFKQDQVVIDLNPIPNPSVQFALNANRALQSQGLDISGLNSSKTFFLQQDLLSAQKKFAILAQDLTSSSEGVSSVPYATDLKNQTSNFNRGHHDEEVLSHFMQNQLLYPEGSPERLGKEYLLQNMQGSGEGVGANLAYFGGSLARKIEKLKDGFTHSCQVIANHIDPCRGDSFDYVTNGADLLLKKQNFSNLDSHFKDSLDILALSDKQHMGMQAAIQRGENLDQLSHEALSYINKSGLTGQPEVYLGAWNKRLGNKLKGVGHAVFDILNGAASFVESCSYQIGVDALEDVFSVEERIQFGQRVAEKVGAHAASRDDFVKGILKIDPKDPHYQSGYEFANAVIDVMAVGALAESALKVGKLITPIGKKAPEFVNNILKDIHIESKGKVLQLEVSPSALSNPKAPNSSFFKVISNDLNAQKIVFGEGNFTVEKLLEAGKALDREGLTKAGRALAKHGGREITVYPKPKGNPAQINAHGQQILESIINHPNRVIYEKPHHQFGQVLYIVVPDIGGVRFTIDGNMIGFLQPRGKNGI